ncbi:zinc finger MYM-type protein 2-like [Mizuhopecten yessoensis]|uniref:zinc finger MYM-type protein 2-like n=1 Tax=Mizuhopecten yessoensis TaxID=6573 RepID=UPI000B45F26A|nr:zinc finger MYM-type protein 2-like [Mizuhopecten yessoensis]XP_021351921.1 zinc finger MYM-type protein 2-like [Mizuhopecten yessoensis]
MADVNIGDSVRIDGKGRGTVQELVPMGFATFYRVLIEGSDIEVDLPGDRLEPIPQTMTQSSSLPQKQTTPNQTQRFVPVQQTEIGSFIEQQSNKNTLLKTWNDMKVLKAFFETPEINESRSIQNIPPPELSPLLSQFFMSVRKVDGSEYEPNSLRSMMSSFDRQLRRFNYGHAIITSPLFAQVREVLKSKQKQLKRDGKGNLDNRSDAISDEEIDVLWRKGQFGTQNPDAILQTLWFFNTVHFGLRGSAEHRDMCWGDVTLQNHTDGHEYLEFTERQTKTRTGENTRDVRKVKPKLWANTENPERCPVHVYKCYADMRPTTYCKGSDPFYIATTTKSSPGSHETWFKRQPVGINKLKSMMQRAIKGAGIQTDKHLSNHSARKYLVQKLNDNNIPANHIMQISGHRNISSINNYSHINTNQHKEISKILHGNPTAPETGCNTTSLTQQSMACNQSTSSVVRVQGGFQSIFSGAVTGGNIQVHVYQGPPLKKRARVIESDSDSQ